MITSWVYFDYLLIIFEIVIDFKKCNIRCTKGMHHLSLESYDYFCFYKSLKTEGYPFVCE